MRSAAASRADAGGEFVFAGFEAAGAAGDIAADGEDDGRLDDAVAASMVPISRTPAPFGMTTIFAAVSGPGAL